jgi:hypothetical protein
MLCKRLVSTCQLVLDCGRGCRASTRFRSCLTPEAERLRRSTLVRVRAVHENIVHGVRQPLTGVVVTSCRDLEA